MMVWGIVVGRSYLTRCWWNAAISRMEQGVMLACECFTVGFLGGKREIASNWNCHKILIKTNVDVQAGIYG